MQPCLRLVPTEHHELTAEMKPAALFADTLRTHSFTELHAMVSRQIERLAKANKAQLTAEGWIP